MGLEVSGPRISNEEVILLSIQLRMNWEIAHKWILQLLY